MAQNTALGTISKWRNNIAKTTTSIGTKIILPYLLLTLLVAGVGAFIVTSLVTSTLTERFNNQLLDAGQVVAERMVGYERERLELLRLISFSEGVPEGVAANDQEILSTIVPQIVANGNVDVVALVNSEGIEVYGWQGTSLSPTGEERSGTDFSQLEDVQLVLDGYEDEQGDKRAVVSQLPVGFMLFTVGPIRQGEEVVGAVLVGSELRKMAVQLTQDAIARVTLYDQSGNVIETTLGLDQQSETDVLQESPEFYESIINLLQESPEQYQVVSRDADSQVQLRTVEILNQDYQLAYGDWRLRGQSFGLFSVGLRTNFIVNTAVTSRNQLSIIFSLATVATIALGYFIARRITVPLNRLVQTSQAIAEGQLDQRTGIESQDEIGTLAHSFDIMTSHLAERNRQLAEQASELEAILRSIADGVLVFDENDNIVASNPAAQRILPHILLDSSDTLIETQPYDPFAEDELELEELLALDSSLGPQRFDIGGRVFSALEAPVETPEGDLAGRVIVLRDTTREAEVEQLKDGFITSVSHELRTPLTSIKGFVDLLLIDEDHIGEQQMQFARVISDNADKMMEHVNKLIDIAEIQSDNLQLRRQTESFARLVRDTVESWQQQMESKDLSLSVKVSDDEMWVYADTVRLVWAIDNLLRNAHDYTPSGGSVEVRVFRKDDDACLDVTDSGIGINAADQPYLFSRFYRIQNEYTFNMPGIGLDLYITRSIIEAHGGRVRVESEPGVGSTFGFVLPLTESPEDIPDI